ncbi:MAG TPA: hypothetical protein VFW80_08535 [Gaiellaceae bacterium]|nr:hypothetical protein [Gaiellaceae bacterium]
MSAQNMYRCQAPGHVSQRRGRAQADDRAKLGAAGPSSELHAPVRHPEPPRHGGAVAIVTVEELDDRPR